MVTSAMYVCMNFLPTYVTTKNQIEYKIAIVSNHWLYVWMVTLF